MKLLVPFAVLLIVATLTESYVVEHRSLDQGQEYNSINERYNLEGGHNRVRRSAEAEEVDDEEDNGDIVIKVEQIVNDAGGCCNGCSC